MSKRLKSVVAVLVAFTLCVSMLSGIFSAQADFSCTIEGDWPTSSSFDWLKANAVTEEQKQATFDAIADELVYQNDVLNFKIGTKDDGGTTHNIKEWDGMVCVEFENYNPDMTDNVGNPWGHTGGPNNTDRLWGVVTVPFPGMAFSVKGELAKQFDSYGKPALSNEFTYDGVIYQLRFENTHVLQDGVRSSIGYFPGSVADNTDGANNTFRYAVANYNQKYKRDGKTLGVPAAHARTTTDGSVFYQEFNSDQGKSYVAIAADRIETANFTGAYIITGELAAKFDELGDDMDARFAVTGAPLSDAVNGAQIFEKGRLTADGFSSSVCNIDSFSFEGEPKAAIIDNDAATVIAFVKKGTDITSLTPNIDITAKSYAPTGAQDFSSPVKYTLTAQDDSTKEYTVKVYELGDADITAFKLGGVDADIDYDTNTITIVAPSSVNLANAEPEIETVGDAEISPSGTVDLSGSWNNGVEFTITSGSETAKYTVKARGRNDDNTIKSVVVKADQFKYADGDVTATIDNDAKKIIIEYPYGNTANRKIALQMTIAATASVSPDPSIARDQTGVTYSVTAESGDVAEYTVEIKIAPSKALPAIDDIEFMVKDAMGGFGSGDGPELAKKAILEEYNFQRSIGFDLGDVIGDLSNWDDVTNRLQFKSEMSTGRIFGDATALITIDVLGGLAYTVKNQMANIWTWEVTVDGQKYPGFGMTGGAVVNEFTMDGNLYQQFSRSYGVVTPSGASRVIVGVGTLPAGNARNEFLASIEDSKWYNTENLDIGGGVLDDFRKAYEEANKADLNPGVALDGALKYNSDYDFVYQVFTGTGPVRATERDSSKKSMIISSDPVHTAFVMAGDWQTIYENIPGYEYVDLEFDGFAFKYAPEIGVPIKPAFQGRDGEWILDFGDWYAYATADDLTDVKVSDGGYYNKENYILSIEFEQPVESIEISDPSSDDPRIDAVFQKGVDLSNLVVKSIQVSEGASANVEPGTVLDCTWGTADIRVTAEDGSSRIYVLFASVSDQDPGTDSEDPIAGDPPGSNPKTGQAAGTAMLLMLVASGCVLAATKKSKKD